MEEIKNTPKKVIPAPKEEKLEEKLEEKPEVKEPVKSSGRKKKASPKKGNKWTLRT